VAIFDHVREVLFLLSPGASTQLRLRLSCLQGTPSTVMQSLTPRPGTLGSPTCGLNTGPRFRSGRGRTWGRQGAWRPAMG
jgi:hypothetical protein